MDSSKDEGVDIFGSDNGVFTQIPTQAQSIVEGSGSLLVSKYEPVTDVDYLQVCHFSIPKVYMEVSCWVVWSPDFGSVEKFVEILFSHALFYFSFGNA